MKRIIAIILACSLLLSGCASSTPSTQAPSSEAPSSNQTEIEQTTNDTSEASTEAKTPEESTAASESSGESTVHQKLIGIFMQRHHQRIFLWLLLILG